MQHSIRHSSKMTLENWNTIHEMDQVFQRIHARLDLRFQQLIRQIHAYSHKKSNFSKVNLTNHLTSVF